MLTQAEQTTFAHTTRQVAVLRDLSYWVFAFQIFSLVFLQKFALPVGKLPISVPMITLYVCLAVLVLKSQLYISPLRLTAVGLLFAVTLVTQITIRKPISAPSFLQFLLLYLPFLFVWRVSGEKYLKLMGVFQNAMIIAGAMVFVQLASQMVLGLGNAPNLEIFVPHKFLLPGYNYAAPITWGQKFVRPNGFFLLEPSFVSSFLASALIIELLFFHRLWRIIYYAAALLGVVAATGIVMTLIAAPLLLARRNFRAAAVTGFAGIIGAIAALATGAADLLLGRFSELGSPRSSAFQRLIAPLLYLRDVYVDPSKVLTGVGAGNSNEVGVSLWPVAKVMIEYGALSGIIFMIFLAICMGRSVNKPLALALFITYNFTGGFLLVPITVIQILLLACLLQISVPQTFARGAAGRFSPVDQRRQGNRGAVPSPG
jgi:hypothetical protein